MPAGEPPTGWRWPAGLLTYAWHSFPEKPVLGSAGTIDLIGNVVFSIAAVILLVVASRTVFSGKSVGSAVRT